MRFITRLLAVMAAVLSLYALPAAAQDKVVYHFDDAKTQATRGLRSIRNHLDTVPATQITVVAHGDGIDFLMDGAKDDKNSIEYSGLISDLASRGVKFQICELTMKLRNLDASKFVLEAQATTSGVARITELQVKEKYAYIKP